MVANIWPDSGATVKVIEWPKSQQMQCQVLGLITSKKAFTRTPLLKWLNSQWFPLSEPVSWRVKAGRGNNVECLHTGLIPTETNFFTPLAQAEEWVSSVTSLLLHTHQLHDSISAPNMSPSGMWTWCMSAVDRCEEYDVISDTDKSCYSVTHLSVHVAEHEIQQEALALPEGSGHWQHHHMFVSDLRSQQNPTQRLCVQSKGVILLAHCDDLYWTWFTPHS